MKMMARRLPSAFSSFISDVTDWRKSSGLSFGRGFGCLCARFECCAPACARSYISTRVTTPWSRLAGSLLNWTKLGVSRLMTENIRQIGLPVVISSMP